MGLDHVRSEIEHMRVQLGRQRKEILQLQRAGISTASAELLLQRMLAKIDVPVRRARSAQSRAGWSHERARPRRPELVMREQLKWYDKDDSSPWIALAELRQRPRVRAIASSMSRRSRLRSTNTQRRR